MNRREDMGDGEPGSGKYKFRIISTIVSVCFLVAMILLNYKEPYNKDFSTDNFYWGKHYEDPEVEALLSMNSKEYYAKMYGSKQLPTNVQCTQEIIKSTTASLINGTFMYWVTGDTVITDEAQVTTLKNTEEYKLFAWKEGGEIVAPVNVTFLNANQSPIIDSDYTMRFTPTASSGTVIEIHNIKNWFCHIGKDHSKGHTILVGKGGVVESASEGSIIGEATADTYMLIYDADGNPITPEEFFFNTN